ncbi:MAG: hypothetical protein JW797_11615 [Bradymonadales bacterium]|nr:hypothetical protein [Bradymonadales bacterium]
MRRVHQFQRIAALLAFLPLFWGSRAGGAQDLQFDEEEELIFDEEEEPIFGEESGLPPGETPGEVVDLPFTTGFIIPNELLDSNTADRLSQVLMERLGAIPQITAVPYTALSQEFEVMGGELALECAFDPVCLGRLGDEVGVDQIVIGRVSPARQSSTIGFTMDLVDVPTRSVLRYRFVEADNSFSTLSSEITRQLPYLFAIEQERGPSTVTGPTGPGTIQVVASWATLALGVASLGVGIYYGLDASSIEDEVRSSDLREGSIYVMTQREARERLDEAEDSALLANIFLGSGVALLGVSALLFLITPGSDIDVEAESVSSALQPDIHLTPAVWGEGWGLFGQFEF